MNRLIFLCLPFLLFIVSSNESDNINQNDPLRLQPYHENPYYWQYKGEPLILLGASNYHNIFQRRDMVEELVKLQSIGGNYIRNSMASREILPDHRDLWPYHIVNKTDDSLIHIFDLDEWNDVYWNNFQLLLNETYQRDLILEIELWERHDYYRTRDQAGWIRHPFNPNNNINYNPEESGFPVSEIDYEEGHPFFATVPSLNNNELIISYQEAFIDKILSYSLEYNHVMYNMNNETREPNEWGEYWANYIVKRADEKGVSIELTDMQDAHDITDQSVARMMDSELFTFVDISQNNFQSGDLHWNRIQYIREYLADNPKPITNIKVYGTDDPEIWNPPYWGSSRDGIERFWRNILGGTSSARFHRPPWGIGFSEPARINVQSARMFAENFNIFHAIPSNHLLIDKGSGSSYLLANRDIEYAVYFTEAGQAELLLSNDTNKLDIRWLDIENNRFKAEINTTSDDSIILSTPGDGHWLAIVSIVN